MQNKRKFLFPYTVDKDGSERLMLKYYEHLLKIKIYLKQAFNLDVLENISDFPLNTDMRFLSVVRMSLTELVGSDQDYYDFIKSKITERAQSTKIYEMLDQCRDIIICNKPGANVLRYLLHKMNNRVIKWQCWSEQCGGLSNLYLNYGCIPFDRMPYCTSLRQHNPRIYDLFESIPVSGHEHELFARYIKNNTEIEGHLFTPKAETEGFDDVDGLIRKYNSSLYYKHTARRITREYHPFPHPSIYA